MEGLIMRYAIWFMAPVLLTALIAGTVSIVTIVLVGALTA